MVTNTQDPEGKDRVRLRVPSLFGPVETGWAFPIIVKEDLKVGDTVFVVAEGEDTSRLLYLPANEKFKTTESSGESGGGEGFVFEQGTPASTWTIAHTLGFIPSVTVVNSAGDVVVGAVQYVGSQTIELSFSGEFSGKAYLS